MDKSPLFSVVEKVLNQADDSDKDEEQGWIDHYIQLADRLLKRPSWNGFGVPCNVPEQERTEEEPRARNDKKNAA